MKKNAVVLGFSGRTSGTPSPCCPGGTPKISGLRIFEKLKKKQNLLYQTFMTQIEIMIYQDMLLKIIL